MSEKKPIVLTEGQQEQLQNGDYLPNQPEINELKSVLSKLINQLDLLGVIEFWDDDIINFKNKNL